VTSHVLCKSDDIAEGTARGFVIGAGMNRLEVVLVRTRGNLLAYLNSCPHQLTPLETFPDKFLNEDGTLFVCSTHGARFRIGDGYCVSGPCEGKSLRAIAFAVIDGEVVIAGILD
jgi:nitrite reductase/ring-hydroxylating ferredoxin subunit